MMRPQRNKPLELRTGQRTELTTDSIYSVPYDNITTRKNPPTTTTNHYESLHDLPFAVYANIASCINTKRRAPFPPKRDIRETSHALSPTYTQTDPLLTENIEEIAAQSSNKSKFQQWKNATMRRLALWLYEKSL